MNLTRDMARVIASALELTWNEGQCHNDLEAELKIWKIIGLLYPDLLEPYTYIPLVQKAIECPL